MAASEREQKSEGREGGGALCEAGELVFECIAWDEAHFLFAEIFERRVYEQHGATLDGCPRCRSRSTSGLIVDAGANIGLFALACATRSPAEGRFPHPRVLSVEPARAAYDVLCRNTADHSNVLPIRAALGQRDQASVSITYFERCPGESTRHPEERAQMRRVLAQEAQLAGVAHLLHGAVDAHLYTADSGDEGDEAGKAE
ncbi:hypothetical protein T492DRAFT_907032, partial [Pavlovales sp. CCMP2436]